MKFLSGKKEAAQQFRIILQIGIRQLVKGDRVEAVKEIAKNSIARHTERKFERLRDEWKSRKSHAACVEEAVLHPAYLKIIGMGSDAVPLILAEMEKEIDHWFCALYAITEADPVPEDARGNMKKMVASWVEWGKNQGYRW